MSIARHASPTGSEVLVATLNVRHTADRWRARAPLLVEQLAALDPDVIGLQEVRRFPSQARSIARATEGKGERGWEVRTTYKTGRKGLLEGIAVLSRLPVDPPGRGGHARLRLPGQCRVAQRVTVEVADGRVLDVYNTHLANADEAIRALQATRLLAWMDERPGVPQVLVGDFNSRPDSAPVKVLTSRLRSAYALVHGSEPSRTLVAGGVLDYIFVDERVTVLDAWVAFDRPDPCDQRVFPSDHLGLAATLSLVPRR